jgi:transcriptional regulator with XRE-family HTH domain
LTLEQIAKLFGVTVEYVSAVERAMIEEVDVDSMDGDNASALASAGFGTDEDYNCYDYCD